MLNKLNGNNQEKAALIFNSIIDKTNLLKDKILTEPEDFVFHLYDEFICMRKTDDGTDKFERYLKSHLIDRKSDKGQFYHLLKYEYALSTLKNQEIQFSALSYLFNNDYSEHIEFDKRHSIRFDNNPKTIEREKDEIFVFCLSENFRNEKSWELYGQNENGIALGIRFKEQNLCAGYDFKNVFYDKGYDFDFINEIQYFFNKEFNKELLISGASLFSKFYKRAKYSWENEVRLCIDFTLFNNTKEFFSFCNTNIPDSINFEKICPIQIDTINNRKYLKLPFKNSLFEMEITEVICGKDITDEQIIELEKVTQNNALIWKRK